MTSLERNEFFKRMAVSADMAWKISALDEVEVVQVVNFLRTLTFTTE